MTPLDHLLSLCMHEGFMMKTRIDVESAATLR